LFCFVALCLCFRLFFALRVEIVLSFVLELRFDVWFLFVGLGFVLIVMLFCLLSSSTSFVGFCIWCKVMVVLHFLGCVDVLGLQVLASKHAQVCLSGELLGPRHASGCFS